MKVVLNELCGNRVECDSFASANKFIELYNAGDAEADLAGWQIIKNNEDIVWTAPEGTKLAAGAYLVLEADTADPAIGFNAGFSAKKEVKIEIKDAAGNSVDVFCRGVDATPMAEESLPENKEASFSRVPNGEGVDTIYSHLELKDKVMILIRQLSKIYLMNHGQRLLLVVKFGEKMV